MEKLKTDRLPNQKAEDPPHLPEKQRIDITLLISRVENEIMGSDDLTVSRRILTKEKIWQQIGVENQFKCVLPASLNEI